MDLVTLSLVCAGSALTAHAMIAAHATLH